MDAIGTILNYLTGTIGLIAGILLCFFGYKMYKFSISVLGFVAGWYFSDFIIGWLCEYTDLSITSNVSRIVKIVFAVICFILAYAYWKSALRTISATVCAVLIFKLLRNYVIVDTNKFLMSTILLVVSLCIGAVAGFVVVSFEKIAVIIMTSVSGAFLVSENGANLLFSSAEANRFLADFSVKTFKSAIVVENYLPLVILILFAVLGILIQIKSNNGR